MLIGILTLGSFSYKVVESTPEQPTNHCIHVTYSCGVQEDVCDFTGTAQQLFASILASDDAICN